MRTFSLPVPSALLALLFLFGADAAARTVSVRVPKVTGLRAAEAEKRLADVGLAVRLIGPARGDGVRVITAQHPAAASSARVGAQVRLTYAWSDFGAAPPAVPGQSPKVRVPRVAGLRLVEAVRRLERAGLGADAIGPTHGERGRAFVVGQNPPAGREVSRRATIRITWRYAR